IKCDKIKVAICQNVSAIKLDIHDNYELKPIVVCRDIDAGQLHLAKNSNNNEKLLEQIRGKLVNIFDVIDSFRATMPIPKEEDIIDDRIFSDETVDNDNKYIIEFDEELFKGKVVVLANGNVNFSLLLCVDDQEYELSKTIRVDEIMSKIPIDVSELKDPIKSIVYASFEKEYAIVNGEVKAI
ncbi:MAG: hypothetical protein K2I70_00065, partial [Bacilli bacterium]|nr:hypothetical protein [Bacilli bacterium]